VEILSDSELIVRQIQGAYRVRHPVLAPYYRRAIELIRGFESFEIRHVRREQNTEADRLVNEELDRAAAAAASPES
jgi:probable phosphoglycerate mutase